MENLSLNGTAPSAAPSKSSSQFDFGSLESSADEDLGGGSSECSPEDMWFDSVVGALENCLMDDDFLAMQQDFCEGNCEVFDEGEEMKLCYTELFQQYTNMIEGFIEARLSKEVEDFSMDK
ncbi:hypothetical protein TeGR_g2640, partial [Tetraparma gracilis]